MQKCIKVKNVLKEKGIKIYKGLDISKIIHGSDFYAKDYSYIILKTTQVDLPAHKDLEEITEVEYESAKRLIFI